ncbi:PREDICTED: uncharacterized protein LOC107104474 [Cyprinodon variegatus]|uniref:uncharacterized protein LOC107104474 n=1 Tax=Cyprinodon variegatus TaxID=28743 RepID=UPI000742B888|nr:PREDICTED: uncharacterized protein LOC107104474 [Cyprinodon variegatus]
MIATGAAGCHQSPLSSSSHSTLVVHRGQNVSLTCNLTSDSEVTWYRLLSDQLLPLLRVSCSRIIKEIIDYNNESHSRIKWTGNLESGLIRLDIQAVEEEDAGLYFCSGLSKAKVCVGRGIHLKINGGKEDPAGGKLHQPCWSLGICVLPGLFSLCSFLLIGLYLCSGKAGHCCCNPEKQNPTLRATEEDSLQYSSLRHPDKPRPPTKTAPRMVENFVIYSTVNTRKNVNALHGQR